MKKIKYILLILIVFILTGCSGNYNLTFNKDLSINEELNILIDNSNDAYERTLDLLKKAEIDPDKYEIMIDKDKVKIVYKETYSSFENYYLNSKLYRSLFENIEYEKDNTGMSINTKSRFKLNDKNNQSIINAYDIDNFKINLSIPFNVTENNADSIKDNTYTWDLNNSDTYKEINLKYDYRNDRVPSIVLISTIVIISAGIILYIIIYLSRNRRI